MTWYQIDLLYDVAYGANVTVEADNATDACRRAIDKADAMEAWKNTDHASDSYVDEIVASEHPNPADRDCTLVPIPEDYTRDGPPPTVTLYGERPPGTVEVAGGTVRLRLLHPRFALTNELADPAPPPSAKPIVTITRRPDGTPDISVTGGTVHLHVNGWDTPPEPAPSN